EAGEGVARRGVHAREEPVAASRQDAALLLRAADVRDLADRVAERVVGPGVRQNERETKRRTTHERVMRTSACRFYQAAGRLVPPRKGALSRRPRSARRGGPVRPADVP